MVCGAGLAPTQNAYLDPGAVARVGRSETGDSSERGTSMRFKFDPNSIYAGRLDRVSKRPVENLLPDAVLLRLEFLIFRISENRLSTRGQIACRDIMLWPGMGEDRGVLRMAKALGLDQAYSAATWLATEPRWRWITICFGDPSPIDQRQPFRGDPRFRTRGGRAPARESAASDRPSLGDRPEGGLGPGS